MPDTHRTQLPIIATWLGRAGLLPFCLLPLAMMSWPQHTAMWLSLLANYSLAILCFLPGAWWGMGLIRRQTGPLVASNALVIVTFMARSLLSEKLFLLAAAALFVVVLAYERLHFLFKPQPAYYARLRIQLTAVACCGLLLGYLAAS